MQRDRSFLDRITSEPTESSERDVERSLRGGRGRPGRARRGGDDRRHTPLRLRVVALEAKDGKLSVTWRYLVRAMIRMRDERDALEATATSSETLTESEANRTRSETYKDAEQLRAARPRARGAGEQLDLGEARLRGLSGRTRSFRDEVKHKRLVQGRRPAGDRGAARQPPPRWRASRSAIASGRSTWRRARRRWTCAPGPGGSSGPGRG